CKANRAANPATSSTLYCRGSSSVDMHKRKMARGRVGRWPKAMELFAKCYKKKADGGWRGPRVAEVVPTAEDHDTSIESEALVAMTEQQLWLAAIRGKNKARVFGLGFEAHVFNRTCTSPSPSPPSNSHMENRIVWLERMMVDMMAMMKSMPVNSLTRGLSQPTASTSGSA
ncbi:UNVERIFIED_CONTAM: hypothetical protein Sindi_2291700, partial [Sesamum indicum]